MLRRLFSLVSAFAVLFFVSVPAFATAVEPGGIGGGTGIPIVGNINLDVVDLFDYMDRTTHNAERWIANTVGHFIDEDICPNAPQVGGGHRFTPRRTLKDGMVGTYNVCDYCGKSYGEACQEAYNKYVDTLPGQRYNSNGYFLWIPSESDFTSSYIEVYFYCNGWNRLNTIQRQFAQSGETVFSSNAGFTLYTGDKFILSGRGASSFNTMSVWWPNVTAPWTARYYAVDGHPAPFVGLFQEGYTPSNNGIKVSCNSASPASSNGYYSGDFDIVWNWPALWVQPFSVDSGSSSFSTNSRPSVSVDASSGDNSSLMLGYVDDGNLVQSQSQSAVFAESANVYTNPVTNTTKTVTNWDYDYTDRSYTLTTEEGDEITVTYGDTNLTINEGGDTYNLYYLTEHDENLPCSHAYSGQITQSPTCTASGLKTFTCSICGGTYTQELPAMGHSYVSSVSTEATCTTPGARTSTCSICGDTRSEVIPATGHSYVSAVTQEATCTSPGVRTSTCSVCGDVQTQTIPATGHNYIPEVTMEPTCTTTGVRTFTCSACGDSYTRAIPATGHRWHILRTVSNQYGADGQLEQAGYTLYECETCGEQYRIDAASSGTELPNAGGGGTTTGTELLDTGDSDDESGDGVGAGFLLTIARGLTEDLPEVLKMVSEWFTTIPALYDSYSRFLATSFTWMPEQCVMLLTFGVGMVILLGILKACFRR